MLLVVFGCEKAFSCEKSLSGNDLYNQHFKEIVKFKSDPEACNLILFSTKNSESKGLYVSGLIFSLVKSGGNIVEARFEPSILDYCHNSECVEKFTICLSEELLNRTYMTVVLSKKPIETIDGAGNKEVVSSMCSQEITLNNWPSYIKQRQ